MFSSSTPGAARLGTKLITRRLSKTGRGRKASLPASPGQPPAAASPGVEVSFAHATRNYWTNYRGPNRDGRYDESPVLTSWPAQGLTPVWKEPVGLGYGSF